MSSLRENYIAHLKQKIEAELSIVTNENITNAFHDEFSYNDSVDMDVTVKYLPGQIQSGVVQYPGEILIAVNEVYFTKVLEALNDFTLKYHEKVVTLGTESYREYYVTPNIIGTFQNNGITNKTAISISFSLITFNNIYGLDPDGLTLCYGEPDTDNLSETIKWLSFAVSYQADGTSLGSKGGDANVKQVVNTAGITYSFTFVPKKSNNVNKTTIKNLLRHLLACEKSDTWQGTYININQEYNLSILMDDLFGTATQVVDEETITTNVAKNISCVLISGTYTQEANGLPIVQVTFQRGDS